MEAIVAEHLAKRYPNGVWGAVDVSFRVERGVLAVLLGPNGAGKTTTIGMLTTLLKPTRGRGLVLGYDVVREAKEVRKRIALCPQDIRIDLNLTPWEAVVGYLMARGVSRSTAVAEARRWLEELELWDVRNRPGWHLSGGQLKRVAVAMVLATGSEVLFLDEPSAGLDVEGKYRVWRALRQIVRDGRTVLMTTHDMREAEIVGDRVVMISQGRVVAEGRVDELRSRLPYSHKLIVRKPKRVPQVPKERVLELGDTVTIYARSYSEALDMASSIEAESVSIEHVSLEDVYLRLVHGG